MTRRRILLLYATSAGNATFSYQQAWPRHFRRHPRFEVTAVNLAPRSRVARLKALLSVRAWGGDAIVLLHSVFSNTCELSGPLFGAVARRAEPKAFFIGNEYKMMPEKMRFCDDLRLALLVSQSSSPRVHALYRDRLGCVVAGVPNTGLDTELFVPTARPADRPIDLGYRADAAPAYLGHTERQDIAGYFQAHAARLNLTVDVSLDPRDRLGEAGWAAFLNRCRGQLGTEAGGDYFELTDRTRLAVNDFVVAHPGATFADIRARFFDTYEQPVPLRIMSGRHVEAAGTKTVQVLFDGWYDGYLKPDEHYIPLRKDFSNVDEVIRKFNDRAFASAIADNAYQVAVSELTYPRLIDRFAGLLDEVVGGAVH